MRRETCSTRRSTGFLSAPTRGRGRVRTRATSLLYRVIFGGIVLAIVGLGEASDGCPQPPWQPTPAAPVQTLAGPFSVYEWRGDRGEAPLGIGHLAVADATDHYYDWPSEVRLPLWRSPGGDFYGWVANGTIQRGGGDVTPLSGAGMVETDYEHQTFVVWRVRKDGWLRVRVSPGGDGAAWTHECHLSSGPVTLAYEPWEALLEQHSDWLIFRARTLHSLRSGPGVEHERIGRIGLDHAMTMLERRGDWMRVRVQEPDWRCAGSEPFPGREREGWIRWRDEEKGPWVWFYTRGC